MNLIFYAYCEILDRLKHTIIASSAEIPISFKAVSKNSRDGLPIIIGDFPVANSRAFKACQC